MNDEKLRRILDDKKLRMMLKEASPQQEIERLLAEITRLREAIRRLADQDATLSVQGGNVTVTMDATLDDAEREAVESAAADDVSDAQVYDAEYSEELRARAATLRGLLERLK